MARTIKNHEMARELLDFPPYNENLAYCREFDAFYIWKDYFYELVTIDGLHDIIHEFMINRYAEIQTTEHLVKDLIYQVKRMIRSERKFNNLDKKCFAFTDCYFDMDNFLVSPTSRDKLVVFNVPYTFSTINDCETPAFYKYLKSTLVKEGTTETDEALIKLLQEMFGLILMDSMKATGAFFLIGTGSNGKSVMINILLNLIGEKFCSSMSIQTLTTNNFALADLVGKKLNVSNEEESKYMKSDVFKSLITGDPVSSDRKFQTRINFRPQTKYLFASNEMPTFEKLNYGLKRRIKIIPFYRQFSDTEADKDLTEKLIKELPGIVAWAIVGAKRLVDNNYTFSEPKASVVELEEFEAEVSSVIRFIKMEYDIGVGFIENKDLYESYRDWCEDNGKKSVNSIRFYKESLRIDGVESIRGTIDGKRVGGKNLKLKEPEYVSDEEDTKTQQAIDSL